MSDPLEHRLNNHLGKRHDDDFGAYLKREWPAHAALKALEKDFRSGLEGKGATVSISPDAALLDVAKGALHVRVSAREPNALMMSSAQVSPEKQTFFDLEYLVPSADDEDEMVADPTKEKREALTRGEVEQTINELF